MKTFTFTFFCLFAILLPIQAQVICIQCSDQTASLNPLTTTNFISNGSFETTNCAGGSYFCPNSASYSCNLTNWTCTGGGLATYAQVLGDGSTIIPNGNNAAYLGNYFTTGICVPNNSTNDNCLQFDDCTVTGIPNNMPMNTSEYGNGTGISLRQQITGLTVGSLYILEFWAGGEPSFIKQGVFAVDLGWGNIFLTCDQTPPLGGIGKRYMITFRATNTSHTIKFTNWGHICQECTEIILDHVKVYPIAEATTTPMNCIPINEQYICEGETYTFNGHTYSETGIYNDTLSSVFGGDSIVATHLTVIQSSNADDYVFICDGETHTTSNGSIYTATGMYLDSIPSSHGCFNTLTTILTVYDVYNITQNLTSCNPADTGTVVNNLNSQNGCDSIVTVITTLVDSYHITQNLTSCNPIDTGTVVSNLTTQSGCDSTITVITALLDSYYITQNLTSCNPADTGTVVINNITQNGCDSIITIITAFTGANCDDNDCNTVDNFNVLTCECEHSPAETADCNDNNPDTIDEYSYETCQCQHTPTSAVLLPSAFSPNGDNINELLKVSGFGISSMHLSIYNRWGQLIFESTDQSQGWNGLFNGYEQEAGIYVALLTYTTTNKPNEVQQLTESVLLVR